MSMKKDIIALAVRILANETSIVRKPEPFEALINDLFGIESEEQRMARNIEVELDRVVETAKRVNIDRKFKKITKDF